MEQSPVTATERQRKSRRARRLDNFEGTSACQVSAFLCGQAAHALCQLAQAHGTSKRAIIERLLIAELRRGNNGCA